MRIRRTIAQARAQLTDSEGLAQTLQRLVDEGNLSPTRADEFQASLPLQLERGAYVLRHLGAHLGIGVIFAFDVVPLPLGTLSRIAWVGGNRLLEEVRGHRDRARVHSLGAFLIAAIPWFGYAAYLLPLRRESPELAFVLANHSWITRSGRSYEQFLAEAGPSVRRFGRFLVPHPEPRDATTRDDTRGG